jgi:hypothetical protein
VREPSFRLEVNTPEREALRAFRHAMPWQDRTGHEVEVDTVLGYWVLGVGCWRDALFEVRAARRVRGAPTSETPAPLSLTPAPPHAGRAGCRYEARNAGNRARDLAHLERLAASYHRDPQTTGFAIAAQSLRVSGPGVTR